MIPIHHTDKQRIHRGWCDRVPHSDRNLLFIVRRHVLHVNGNANTHLQNTLAILPDVHSHMVCKLFLLRRADVPANPTYPSASILSRTLCYRSKANHLASLVLAHHKDVQNALIRHVVNVCHDQGLVVVQCKRLLLIRQGNAFGLDKLLDHVHGEKQNARISESAAFQISRLSYNGNGMRPFGTQRKASQGIAPWRCLGVSLAQD